MRKSLTVISYATMSIQKTIVHKDFVLWAMETNMISPKIQPLILLPTNTFCSITPLNIRICKKTKLASESQETNARFQAPEIRSMTNCFQDLASTNSKAPFLELNQHLSESKLKRIVNQELCQDRVSMIMFQLLERKPSCFSVNINPRDIPK